MSEPPSEPATILTEYEGAVKVAREHGLSDDARSILNALVIHGVGESPTAKTTLIHNAGWSDLEYENAIVLERNLRELGAWPTKDMVQIVVVEPTDTTEVADTTKAKQAATEALSESPRAELVNALDKAFHAEAGMAEAWLSGNNPANAARFRNMLRLSLGLDRRSITGLLMITPSHGGVGMSMEETQMLGVGLGYNLLEQRGQIVRHDSRDPIVFDEFVAFQGEDGSAYADKYHAALRKLVAFGRAHVRQRKQQL